MSYDPAVYEERQAANDKSRRYALRDRDPWTEEDDEFILEFWVRPGPQARDESEIARALERTIEACRNRAHKLAGDNLGRRYMKEVTTTTRTVMWTDDDEWPEWYVRG